jgi:predicted acyl esterase
MRSSRILTVFAIVSLAGALTAPTAAGAAQFGADVTYQTIPGEGGAPMRGFVVTPTGRGNGPFPLIVMPSSWGAPNVEYVGAARRLAAESGDVVISYTSRGFYDSGGEIDIAGPDTIADVSRVIDWALANTPSDGGKVGIAGISYGAGIGLLAAGRDNRVKAVASMSTWADLEASLYPGETISQLATGSLLALGHVAGRPGPDLRKITDEFLQGRIDHARSLAPSRSAVTTVDKINANGAAVMIANSWQDAIFPPNQAIDFYDRLSTPKRLMLQGGDHATSELLGAIGLSNDVWDAATRWFDHYLGGANNGIDRTPPVQLMPANGSTWRGYPAMPTRTESISLSPDTFATGVDTIAGSGVPLLGGALQGYFKIPAGVFIPGVVRALAGVWYGPVYSSDTTVVGRPRIKTTVTPSEPDTSLFAYLYDVDDLGFGSLVSHKPLTIRGATPGKAVPIDFALESISWDVPAGHRLVLVVDTEDLRYTSESKLGGTLSFSQGQLLVPRG